jgi:uracil-DNA glycosylase
MNISAIDFKKEVDNIIQRLSKSPSNPIQLESGIVPPFIGRGEIKLIIIGQDSTIRNVERRKNITVTLNLDRNGALRTYIEKICHSLGIRLDNVYATNLFKYFYTIPPAQTFDVLKAHLKDNLSLLTKELSVFQKCPIITLGEPVLKLLVNQEKPDMVRYYWDYNKNTKCSEGNFHFVSANDNKLARDFFPFCHQPSIRKEFYKKTFEQYVDFTKKHNTLILHS